jgi:Fic family protein
MMLYNNMLKKIDILKKELAARRPLTKSDLQKLKEYYRVGLTYTSNALEGNSLTETETKIVLEEGITIGGKLIKDHLEAIGHSDAYDLLYDLAKNDEIHERDIKKLHKLFYVRLDPQRAGTYRKQQVYITGTDFVPPAPREIAALMKTFARELPLLKKKYHPVEYAALLHLRLVTIHPFVDGNGRCARLLMNLVLLQEGYGITIIPPVVRADYINSIKRAQTQNDQQPFINFITTMVYETQKDYMRLIAV